MRSAEQDNRAVSECEVKVTLNATETGEPIRKHFTKVLRRAGREAALNVKGSFEEGSGR
jgi:hypothetical protein